MLQRLRWVASFLDQGCSIVNLGVVFAICTWPPIPWARNRPKGNVFEKVRLHTKKDVIPRMLLIRQNGVIRLYCQPNRAINRTYRLNTITLRVACSINRRIHLPGRVRTLAIYHQSQPARYPVRFKTAIHPIGR
jgi:hypothetical protein